MSAGDSVRKGLAGKGTTSARLALLETAGAAQLGSPEERMQPVATEVA
jgi:hypothetical protein